MVFFLIEPRWFFIRGGECRRPSRYCTIQTYFCTVRWYFLARPTKVRRKTCERARPLSQASEISGYERSVRSQKGSHVRSIPCPFVPRRNHTEGHGDPRKDPMSVQSPVGLFPEGIPRKVTAILGGIPWPLRNPTEGHIDPRGDPMSIRSHVRRIPCPSDPRSVRARLLARGMLDHYSLHSKAHNFHFRITTTSHF
jgi:hypothetical protein